MDITTLLSPSGGYGYEENINNTALGLALGFAFDPGLFEKFIGNPLIEESKGLVKKDKKLPKVQRGLERVRSQLSSIRAQYTPTSFMDAREKNLMAAEKKLAEQSKNILDRYSKNTSNLTKKLKLDRRFLRVAGWTTLASFALDLTATAFTPGVSKVAAKKDQEALAPNPFLDSPASYTMRQRAIMAIHDSMMTQRNVIGNEAQFMHR